MMSLFILQREGTFGSKMSMKEKEIGLQFIDSLLLLKKGLRL